MDEEWARGELRAFIDLTRIGWPKSEGIIGDFREHVGPEDLIVAQAAVVEQILGRVLPLWRTDVPAATSRFRWKQHWEAATRALSQLERAEELRQKLGDNSPTLSASALHSWAWSGARSLWQSGHYREAVQAAAVKVNAETQNKLGRRDIAEAALFQLALSNDQPSANTPRLRPAGDDGGKTSLSVRRGIVALAEGAYGALRNPIGHDEGELSEQNALEQLAVFSVLARAIDSASIERARQ
ncbi:TIGR02391 family protein [Salinibacterium sp. SWN167]|uniref:TIGR02391 family protein n=1 Tax=Salinibacterium sp. SWN167 TaxID=2792054 RepID=UPI0018CF52BC|nr:TIGR02391 family protein [Salinibacterium sp. SWN167]MBH0084345.1 TIGR02391 family protein [Salinibacterium sp. SWN167]